ncbi:MAG: ABC transporter permease subunit [Erysipelotrichaceae bacterium]|nr:ABC transporter permease subunit [Erysipelotrichaceae bacterium]MBQ3412445.1 ABC transporter permease subunit [Oscillospiraceae bacterium]
MKKSKKETSLILSQVIIAVILFVFILMPFIRMVIGIKKEDIDAIVHSPMFGTAVTNSLKTCITTTIISVLLAMALAFAVQRTGIKGKAFLTVFVTLPMLIPSISVGTSMIVLFGTNGVITNLLHLNNTIYGFWGIVIGAVLYSYPVAFIMFNDVLKYEDASPYEAAQVLGIPKFRRFLAITLPYLKKPLIGAVFSVFSMTVTDYGVPLMIGGKTTTLAVMMYQEVIGQLKFKEGSVIGLFLLIPAFVAFIYNAITSSQPKLAFVSKEYEVKKNRIRDGVSYLLVIAVSLFILILLAAFVMYGFVVRYPRDMTPTLDNVRFFVKIKGLMHLKTSMIISLIVAVIGIAVTFVTAYLTARSGYKSAQFLHLMSMTSLAIPGIVLGLAYVLVFKGTFFYGTLAIIIVVDLMHFFASPYLMMYNSLGKMNQNLEAVGFTLGISRLRMIKDVIIPQIRSTFLEVFSYFFVNSMMTISAVSFLFTYKTKPISLMIGQFEAQMNLECAAIVSLVILVVNLLMKFVIYLIKKQVNRKSISAVNYGS